ncbi:hypothetical protein [Streptomyces sp. NEAU-W12]|uniref:hypothetical protein n=1 Tax=Streptomyces sp. NEAU-W12 TaxID=2994668 RepID=UPI00224B2474|nr:hypothetical protein [Streptomyces sp. NEAU-W12]MCX2928143.1 hypothetical protein [Streptomyces sp. NEAU-W12]
MSTSGPSAAPIPLHIAGEPPAPPAPDVIGTSAGAGRRPDPAVRPGVVDWAALGVEPRWRNQETGDCAAILSPFLGPATGLEPYKRYVAGTRQRGETALVVACTGAGTRSHNVFTGTVAPGIHLPHYYGSISANPLPVGVSPELADGLDHAEHDLGTQLLNCPPDTWFRLTYLRESKSSRPGVARVWPPPGEGELRPILVDGLGAPVAGVWTPADGSARWFVVPHGTDHRLLVKWLVQHALPAYVPGALTRARSPLVRDPALATDAEARLVETIAEERRAHERRHTELQQQLAALRAVADPLRDNLLFGTGRPLEDAVHDVLVAAGATVTRLDDVYGTNSADLLAEYGGRRVLVEVKSAKNRSPHTLPDKLLKHLSTWPGLTGTEPVDGGVLVVNHQIKLPPAQRDAEVYTDRAFADALTVPVIGSDRLFDWWRHEDWDAVRHAVFGDTGDTGLAQPPEIAVPDADPKAPGRPGLLSRLRR